MAGRIGPLPQPPSVVIGPQTWMLNNLDVTTYRDGTPIPEVTDNAAWAALTTGAWCYYNNNPANGAIYGKLYNWYAVNNPKGLAPIGYHVPSDTEWTILSNTLGGSSVAGGPLKETGTIHWLSPNTGATNSTGFTALPGGYRYIGIFFSINNISRWWSSTEWNSTNSYMAELYYDSNLLGVNVFDKTDGHSVRCIKD